MTEHKHYWPRSDEHVAVVGRNGTGKSQLGFFLLSLRDHSKRISFVIDYKREQLFTMLRNARYVNLTDALPKEPGLYIARALPEIDDDAMENLLWRILDKERIGLFADEGYMLPNDGKSRAFKGILTQGRAKRIPVITLSQRPVNVSRFAFSEASHIVALDLNDEDDQKTVGRYTARDFLKWFPPEFAGLKKLPDYHARWYGVKKDTRHVIAPVPPAEEIAASIDAQLKPVRRWF